MRSSLLPVSVALLLTATLPLLSEPAWAADSVRLRSGRTLSLTEYALEHDGLRVVRAVGTSGTLGVRLAYRSVDPTSLEALFRERAADAKPAERMRLAGLALQAGLPNLSEGLFSQGMHLDAHRDAALAGVKRARAAVVADTLQSLSDGVATGQNRALLRERMSAFAAGPYADALTAPQRMQIAALQRLVEPVAVPVPEAVKDAAPPVDANDPVAMLRARLGAVQTLRERAADPKSTDKTVRTLLTRATRTLRTLRKEAGKLEADALEAEATDMLVATLVELADVHRQARRFDQARAYVRSALLFRPENAGALQQRRLIEDDLAAVPYESDYDPYRSVWSPYYGRGFETYWIGPAFGSYRHRHGFVRGFSLRRGHFGIRTHRHRHHDRRVVGRRVR